MGAISEVWPPRSLHRCLSGFCSLCSSLGCLNKSTTGRLARVYKHGSHILTAVRLSCSWMLCMWAILQLWVIILPMFICSFALWKERVFIHLKKKIGFKQYHDTITSAYSVQLLVMKFDSSEAWLQLRVWKNKLRWKKGCASYASLNAHIISPDCRFHSLNCFSFAGHLS